MNHKISENRKSLNQRLSQDNVEGRSFTKNRIGESEHSSSVAESSWVPTDSDHQAEHSESVQGSLRDSSSWIPTGSSSHSDHNPSSKQSTTTSSGSSIVRFLTRDDSVIGYGTITSNGSEHGSGTAIFPPRTTTSLFQKCVLCCCSWCHCGDPDEIEQESKEWIMYWKKCQHEVSVWDLGGIRYKAYGNPKQLTACAICDKISWSVLYRKSEGYNQGTPKRCNVVRHRAKF